MLTCCASSQHAFTLVELLVVLVLVGILASTVILGFTGADTEQRLKGNAQNLADTIELARQYALQRNREWGLYVQPDSVRFVEFDPGPAHLGGSLRAPLRSLEIMDNVDLGEIGRPERWPARTRRICPTSSCSPAARSHRSRSTSNPNGIRGLAVTSDGISRTRANGSLCRDGPAAP